jgi:hypothetical protein
VPDFEKQENRNTMNPMEQEQLERRFQEALRHHQRGNLSEALSLYQQILQRQPGHADALHLSGVVAFQTRNYAEATELIGKAIELFPMNPAFFNNRGLALKEIGRFDESIASYDRAIRLKPDYHQALYNRGIALKELKRLDEAIASYERTIQLNPDHHEAFNNRGVAFKEMRRFDEAIDSYDQAIRLKPDYAEAYYNRGNAFKESRLLDEAIDSYDQAIRLKPDYAEAYYNRGNAFKESRLLDEAIDSYDQAIRLKPDFAEAFHNRGIALQEIRRLEEAIASYDRSIQLTTDHHEAYYNRGIALQELKRFDEAISSYDQAIQIKPDYHEAYLNQGNVLKEIRRLDEAIASYDRAIQIKPDFHEAFNNRGIALHEVTRVDEAIDSYDQAIRLKPDYHEAYWNKSLALLMKGDFEEGWNLFEWRWKIEAHSSAKHDFQQPLWLGKESLIGKTILLHREQGLGDTIQFCRYTQLLAGLGARVVLAVEPALVDLLGRLEGIDRVIATGQALPPFDYQCPLMSLPSAFKTTIETIPCSVKYLSADPGKVDYFRKLLGKTDRPRVGLVWSGGYREHQPELWSVNKRRNIPFDRIARFKSLDLDFISLQKGEPAESELRATRDQLWPDANLRVLTDKLTDFSATAALIEQLDLVIAVDTSVAHLAGALGKPVWLLNRYDTCWRWLLDREDSPWYPTMKIYRQPSMGDWDSVIDRAFEDLRVLANG